MDPKQATLAGLLHDIGKFWQRAEGEYKRTFPPGFEGAISAGDHDADSAHAVWSAIYLKRFVPVNLYGDLSTVLDHHQPRSPSARLLALADRLAAGEDRATCEKHPRYLRSVFSQVFEMDTESYLPLKPLQLESIFAQPADFDEMRRNRRKDYAALWQSFEADSAHLANITDMDTLLTEIFYLLERYTWSIPTTYYPSARDISLFDHSRVTAAIAACLATLDDATITALLDSASVGDADKQLSVANLLEGDISGVQNFIYTITARGATSALRGRSFYLQMLTEAVAHFVLNRLTLPISNLIYAGGGHFYMLVPANAKDELAGIRRELDTILLEAHNGELYVALGHAALTCADLQANAFHAKWREASQRVSAAKRRRFGDMSPNILADVVFEPRGHGGNQEKECQVCHYEGDDVRIHQKDEDDTAPVYKCALCASLEDLGRDLRDAQQIAFVHVPQQRTAERTWQAILARLGLAVLIRDADRWGRGSSTGTHATLLGLDDFPTHEDRRALQTHLHCPTARGLRFMVNVTPRLVSGKRATFEDLQKEAEGLKRLGVLRMDVDNLGSIFARGFQTKDANGATLARVASLSAALSRFFEGWVGKLCRDRNLSLMQDGRSGAIYSIYSGGDDLFIVGTWNHLPELARLISAELGRYASGNPNIHISAGLTLHGGKEPLYQAAEAAHEALESAKDVKGKASISMFGSALKWTDFEQARQYRETLRRIVTDAQNRSILQLLMELYRQQQDTIAENFVAGKAAQTQNGKPQVIWGPYMWRGAYQLTRQAERAKAGREVISDLLDEIQKTQFTNIALLGFAARWVEAETRRTSDANRE